MTFRREIHHEGLRRSRIVEGPDPHSVEQRARVQIQIWNRLWESKEGDGKTPATQRVAPDQTRAPDSHEEGRRIAAALTEQALQALKELGKVFPGESFPAPPAPEDLDSFTEVPPEEPDLPYPKPRPLRGEDRFRPRLSLLDRIIPARRRLREREASERFQVAWAAWYEEEREVQETLVAYEARFREWDQRRIEFETEQRTLLRIRQRVEEGLDPDDAFAVIEHFSTVLDGAPLPSLFPREVSLSYEPSSRTLAVDYRLPAQDDIPTMIGVTYREEKGDYLEDHLSEADRQAVYDSVVYQLVLRVVQEALSSAGGPQLQSVRFTGWAHILDPATGMRRRVNLATLEGGRDLFDGIVPKHVSPGACFRALGGLCAGEPHDYRAVSPLGTPGRETGERPRGRERRAEGEQTDLIAKPVRDFQEQMEKILEDRFLADGWDLQITIARQDGGMEAIARGPDPERRPRMLFQVVRSVVPVGEKEVRTLLARMASEKIGRGVLLATSSFTSEAGDLARKKSISLFDGVALKKLLENEGTPSRPTQDGFSDEQEFLETGPQ